MADKATHVPHAQARLISPVTDDSGHPHEPPRGIGN